MTATTHDEYELQHVTAELEGLQRSLPLLVETWVMTLLLMARIGNVWALLKMLEHDAKAAPDEEPIDPDDQLDTRFLRLAESVDGLVRRLDQLGFRNLRIRLVRRLLVRLHSQIERLRIWIREHDADCSPVHGPYKDADALIAALNAKNP